MTPSQIEHLHRIANDIAAIGGPDNEDAAVLWAAVDALHNQSDDSRRIDWLAKTFGGTLGGLIVDCSEHAPLPAYLRMNIDVAMNMNPG